MAFNRGRVSCLWAINCIIGFGDFNCRGVILFYSIREGSYYSNVDVILYGFVQ